MVFRAIIAVCALVSLSVPASAQERKPGDACSGGQLNHIAQVGGPESGGAYDIIMCDGSTWQSQLRLTSAGTLGLGTATPGHALHLVKVDTGSTGGTASPFNSSVLVHPDANHATGDSPAGRVVVGAHGSAEIPSYATNSINNITGLFGYAVRNASVATEKVYGGDSYAENGASGTLQKLYGGRLGAYSYAGTVNEMRGADAWSYTEGTTVASQYGLSVYAGHGSGAVTNQYGASIWLDGTPDSRYGLYIGGTGTPTTQNWAIYQEYTELWNYFDGRVTLGVASPTYRLSLPNSTTNSIGKGIANAWATYSDGRFKKDVTTIEDALDKVLSLRGVSYTWKGDPNAVTEVGLVAQEVREAVPEVVNVSPGSGLDEEGNEVAVEDYHTVSYDRLVPVLIEAVKEQQAQIEALSARIEALESR